MFKLLEVITFILYILCINRKKQNISNRILRTKANAKAKVRTRVILILIFKRNKRRYHGKRQKKEKRYYSA